MKKISIYFTVLLLLIVINSCRDESLLRYPDWNENIGAVTKVDVNPEKTFFDASNDLATEEVEFTIDVDGFGVTEVTSVEVVLTFTEKDGALDEEGKPVDKVYDPVQIAEASTFPSTITVTGQEVADALGWDPSDFEIGDAFQLTFPINTADGRRITVALSSELCNQPAQPSFGGCDVSWSVACPFVVEDAVGTYQVVTDEWADWAPGEELEVVANADGTGVIVKGMYSKYRSDSRGPYDVEILVDAVTGVATVSKQPAWEWFWYAGTEQYGTGSVAGGGVVFSCIGQISVTLQHTVAAGSFGTYALVLQKE